MSVPFARLIWECRPFFRLSGGPNRGHFVVDARKAGKR